MPVHDWTQVSAGTFHAFHNAWITHLQESLNDGILPPTYYALGEQVAGDIGPDVLTLQTTGASDAGGDTPPPDGAVALAEAPPRVSIIAEATGEAAFYLAKRRTLVIRHASDDRVVAIAEIISPGNKHSQATMDALLDKIMSAFSQGVHLLVIDLFPPTRFDPGGIHGLIWEYLEAEAYTLPEGRPLTLAAYRSALPPTAFVEPVAVGMELPDMPLFLTSGHYVNVPLEATYSSAWHGMPQRWRKVIE